MSSILPQKASTAKSAEALVDQSPVINVSKVGAPLRHFMVGKDRDGHWIAKESHGMAGGIFVSWQAAIDYAQFETGHRPGAVSLVPQVVELGF